MAATGEGGIPARGAGERLLFDRAVSEAALFKYGAAVGLTLKLYDRDGALAVGPVHPTPLYDLLGDRAPDLFGDCARSCLRTQEAPTQGAVVCLEAHGLGVVGVPLRLGGDLAAVVVAGYALVEFAQAGKIERLARETGVAFPLLWEAARREVPVPRRRLESRGELLQVLGNAILEQNVRARRSEGANVRLEAQSVVKDEVMAMLSHELRTPLAPILAWAEVLRAGADPAQARRAGEVIRRSVLLQTRLVDDLLDYNRATRGGLALETKRHALDEVLAAAADAVVQIASSAGVTLEIARPGEPLAVDGDAGRLQQIFVNILSNACKFTPPGGRVDVTLARAGETAVVTIADTGEGIAPEFLPFVFELFRQQEHGVGRRHSGLGVGLALVKQLIEMHGGDVSVASEGKDRGATVTVRLPLAREPVEAMATAPAEQATSRAPLLGLTILLADDSDDSREVTRLLLERLGAHVVEARDGVEALEMAATTRPDVVLCDLGMPRMDGFAFRRELHRELGGGPPVVAMSGLVREADRARTRAAGFAAHVGKPFGPDELLAAIAVARRRESD